MSTPAKPGEVGLVNLREARERCLRLAGSAAMAGFVLGALTVQSLSPAAVAGPGEVNGALLKIGESLCEDWRGLANVKRMGEDSYTFTCKSYAQFHSVEVWLAGVKDCRTDTECEAAYGKR